MTDMSDHFVNFIILHSSKKFKLTDRPRVKIFSENNKDNFKNLISSINWEEELKSKSVNEAMLIFNKKFQLLITNPSHLKVYLEKKSKINPGLPQALNKVLNINICNTKNISPTKLKKIKLHTRHSKIN